MAQSRSAEIRARLDHPVIDGDGHVIEYEPIFLEYLTQVAGPGVARRYEAMKRGGAFSYYGATDAERFDRRLARIPYWIHPAKNTLDRATAMLPGLLRARMDEFGIDFSILYTSKLHVNRIADEEVRRAGSRALNIMLMDMVRSHADRMTPACVIPMHTPEEALEALNHAVTELGAKAIMIAGIVHRPVPLVAREAPDYARYATWIDNLALGSLYDYDPFWQRCVDLKVAPTIHATGVWGTRADTRNFVHNHIGHFAASGEAACRALFLGGVTRRFPGLRFGFQEGGVNWACGLYNDLFEHWEKRNHRALLDSLDPARIDRALLARLAAEHGGTLFAAHVARLAVEGDAAVPAEDPANLDDFSASGITSRQDIYDRFVPAFHFGCEADDRMTHGAFDTRANHLGARLKATFSSDIGHWDVSEMREVVAEAYEGVEHGLLSEEDFRDFTFTNLVSLHGSANEDFFKGTAIEQDVMTLKASRGPTKRGAAA